MLLTAEQAVVARRCFTHAHNDHDRALLLEAFGFRPVNGQAPGKMCAGGCGTFIPAGTGRNHDADWWCNQPACHRQMIRTSRQRTKGRPVQPRTVSTCQRCGGPYHPVPGRNSPYQLCSKTPACIRERLRKSGQDYRDRQRTAAA